MRALVLRGKNKGEVEISQWCNDWFSTMDGKIYSPAALAFTEKDFIEICQHNNNGQMFNWYEPKDLKESILVPHKGGEVEYTITFKKR